MASKVKPINEMKLVFPAISINESFARTAVSSFIGLMDPKMDELIDIKTAVSEAVTNCIVHAYRDRSGNIELSAKILPDRTVYIKIRDRGCGIENVGQAMEPLFTTHPEEERSGLGFSVMESFCDEVKVSSKPGSGTTVTLRKKLGLKL
ncbi:MAG: anti-sigma F factor [Oscillospiraceae bacterium]|nr:anti-sigma F factor [Ruminococcus sp.]MCD8344577.1 anti-sigma F factor [Oscillospiraceae bacterium]